MEVRKTKFWRITRQECCREISESLKILKHRYETALVIIFRNLCIFLPGIFTCKPTRLIFFFLFFFPPPYRRCHYENTRIDANFASVMAYSLNCQSIVLLPFSISSKINRETKRLISIPLIIRIRIDLDTLVIPWFDWFFSPSLFVSQDISLLINRTSPCNDFPLLDRFEKHRVFAFSNFARKIFAKWPPHRSPFNPPISNNLHILPSENQRERVRGNLRSEVGVEEVSSISGGIACLRPRVSRDITRRRVRHFTWKFALTPEGLCRNKKCNVEKKAEEKKKEASQRLVGEKERERENWQRGGEGWGRRRKRERERKEAAYMGKAMLPVQGACTDFPTSLSNLPLPPSTIIISPSLPDEPPFFFSIAPSTTVTEIYPAMRDRETRGLHACRCMWDAHAPW